ncbi:hypothetical protein ACFXAE_36000 [Streptomyces sp. NPDC059454]|uniref:hypothetical protein n=1 Tax=Streptomyces sp. NPDC059454 TaxID=3346836 RepID=UPI00368B2C8B
MEDTYLGEELSRLKALCPPPGDSVPVRTVTRGTGDLTVPVSHKDLTGTYGAGCFDEFLWVFADGALNSHLDITERTEQMRAILRGKALTELSRTLDKYQAGPDDLVQWGVTDNADLLAWITRGDPADWPTVIIQAGQLGAVVSTGSSTATIFDLLTGVLRVPFFPVDFPGEQPEFSVNPYG